MVIKTITLATSALVLSTSVTATTYIEDFSAPFPQWESGWLGLNSNIQNFYGVGSTQQNGGFLWLADNDEIRYLDETVEINFDTVFASSITRLSFDWRTYVDTSIQVYDISGNVLLDYTDTSHVATENIIVSSTSGISGFSLFNNDLNGIDQIEGNVAIDNVVVKTAVVPIPAAVWLFGSGLISLIAISRRRNITAK